MVQCKDPLIEYHNILPKREIHSDLHQAETKAIIVTAVILVAGRADQQIGDRFQLTLIAMNVLLLILARPSNSSCYQ